VSIHSRAAVGRRRRGPVLGVLMCLTLVVLAGCGRGTSASQTNAGSPGQSDYTIAYITHAAAGDSFWSTLKNGAQAAADAAHVKLDYQNSNGDPQKQARMVDSAVTNHASAIVVSLPDPAALMAPLQRAKAANIPVFSVNSGLAAYKSVGSLAHVGEDESVAGQGVGTKLNEAGLHSALCVQQEQGNVGLEEYCKGIASTFSGKVTNLFVNGTGDVSGSAATMRAKLASDPSIDVVFSLSPDLAVAAEQAITGASSKAKLAVWNLSPDVIQGISSGKILFAEDEEPYLQGYQSVTTAYLYLKDLLIPGGPILTGPAFVEKGNLGRIQDLTKAGIR